MACKLCNKTVERANLALHKCQSCPLRIVSCEYCNFRLPAVELFEHHVGNFQLLYCIGRFSIPLPSNANFVNTVGNLSESKAELSSLPPPQVCHWVMKLASIWTVNPASHLIMLEIFQVITYQRVFACEGKIVHKGLQEGGRRNLGRQSNFL